MRESRALTCLYRCQLVLLGRLLVGRLVRPLDTIAARGALMHCHQVWSRKVNNLVLAIGKLVDTAAFSHLDNIGHVSIWHHVLLLLFGRLGRTFLRLG